MRRALFPPVARAAALGLAAFPPPPPLLETALMAPILAEDLGPFLVSLRFPSLRLWLRAERRWLPPSLRRFLIMSSVITALEGE